MAMAMSAQQDLRRIDKEIEEIAKIYASQSAHQLEAARSKLTNADRRHMKRYHPEFLDPNVTIADLRTLQHAILSNTPATQPSRIKD